MNNEITLEAVQSALDTVTFIELPDERFQILGKLPEWLKNFNPQITPDEPFDLQHTLLFLETFIPEVRDTLHQTPHVQINSGPWCESDHQGHEHNFSALATSVDGRVAIQLKRVEESQLYYQSVFQKAREYGLNYEGLLKEQEKKDVLLHTIVHDLSTPLTAIFGALSVLEADAVDPESANLLEISLRQCQIQQEMIRSILDTFSAELAAFDPANVDYASAPDIVACSHSLLTSLIPAFANQQVTLQLDNQLSEAKTWKVMGELTLLRRVISNLLENALRYSPPSSQTTLGLSADNDSVLVTICDQGPGVPEAVSKTLFDKFSGGHSYGGKSGIGLYFCRITIEKWGGKIGFDNKPEGGACFWFRLPLVQPES